MFIILHYHDKDKDEVIPVRINVDRITSYCMGLDNKVVMSFDGKPLGRMILEDTLEDIDDQLRQLGLYGTYITINSPSEIYANYPGHIENED